MIALVIVDHDQPHLDRAFEYEIPPELENFLQLGQVVKVRFARRKIRGWVVGFQKQAKFSGKLMPVLSIETKVPLFDANLLKTCQYLATRFGANLSQVFSLALPTVNKAAEAEVLATLAASSVGEMRPAADLVRPLTSFLARSADVNNKVSEAPSAGDKAESAYFVPSTPNALNVNRVVRLVLPGERPSLLAKLTSRALTQSGSIIVVVPTAREVELVSAELSAHFPGQIFCLHPNLKSKERHQLHLQAKLGLARIVVGTRSALWLPLANLVSIVVWDDADSHLRAQHFPHVDAVDVAVARSFIEHISVVFAAYSRSIKTEQLVQSNWAIDATPPREVIRQHTPRVAVFDDIEAAKEGPSGLMLLPDRAFSTIRKGLATGPVLCQVLSAGWVKQVCCQKCATMAACPLCSREISKLVEADIWGCESGHDTELVCSNCGGRKFVAKQSGADQIAAELKMALPRTKIVVSASSTQVLRTISAEPIVVVSTPGAEPLVAPTSEQPAGLGYAAVVITKASARAFRAEFGALLEASRKFFNALALGRPKTPGLVIGEVPRELEQALTLWDPRLPAQADLADRKELGFFPSKWLVAIDGEKEVIHYFRDIVFGVKTIDETKPKRARTAENELNSRGLVPDLLLELPLVEKVPSLELVGEFPLSTPVLPATDGLDVEGTANSAIDKLDNKSTSSSTNQLPETIDLFTTIDLPENTNISKASVDPTSSHRSSHLELESIQWRCLVRCHPGEAMTLMSGLRQIVRVLSRRSKPYPQLEVNPIQISSK